MGFFVAKCIFALSVATIFQVSTPPYFPIEVSRCIASNERALHVWFAGLFASTLAVLWEGLPSRALALLFCALALIGYFDDVTNWTMHMLGVALLGFVCLCLAHTKGQWLAVALAGSLYGARIVLKYCAIVWYETQSLDIARTTDVGFRIMYTGQCKSWQTKAVFQTCGIMQWAVFVILSTLF